MNEDTFIIISLKLHLIMSMAEAVDVVEVHALAEDPALDCYRSTLVLFRILMERFQVNGYSWIPFQPQVYAIANK